MARKNKLTCTASQMHREFVKKLTNLVEANLENENFGSEELAKEAGMSQSNLNRKLKSINKQTISQFIREIRLKKAKELLQNEDLTIAEISYRVGFGSPTYFNNCFHEYYGVAPGEMRNREPEIEPEEKPVESLLKKSKQTKIMLGLAISLIVVLPLAYFLVNKYSIFKTADAKEKSIAVLPFAYLSNDTTNQYLANGMMDAILLNLSKIKDLRVISRTSVEQYRTSEKPVSVIGKELDVAYLLEGSFQKVDHQMRLIVQLIKTHDEGRVWSNNYDRNWKDVFSVQSEVAETVAGELQAAITPEEKQLIRKVPTLNLTAYDFCQKGNEEYYSFIYEGNIDISKIENAKKLFLKALKMDSTLAQAYAGLAITYYQQNKRNAFFFKNYLDSVLIYANKALSFDSQLAEAIRIRGNYYFETGNPEKARIEYEKTLKLNPNNWQAYTNLGIIYRTLDDYVSSIRSLHNALVRNRGPELGHILASLGAAYENAGFIDKAKQCYEEKLALNNDSVTFGFHMVWLEYEIGNYKAAYSIENKTFSFNPNYVPTLTLSILAGYDEESYKLAIEKIEWIKKYGGLPLVDSHRIGYALLREGKNDEAKYYFDKQIEYGLESIKLGRASSADKTAYYDLAAAYAITGDKEKAYQNLYELNKKKTHPLFGINLIKHDPLFDNIRNEPRFQAIVKDMESKYQAEHDRVVKWLAEQGML